MAVTIRETLISIGQVINSIKALAEENGWTIDRYDAGSRVHIHKGETLHFDIYYYDNRRIAMVACSGYDSGSSATAQPGASSYVKGWICNDSVTTSNEGSVPYYRLVATGNTIYCFFGYCQSSSYPMNMRPMAFGEITDKIGNWNDGQFVNATYSYTSGYSLDFPLFGDNWGQTKIDGVWYNLSSQNGVNCDSPTPGSWDICPHLRSKQPNVFNAGILPLPITIFKRNADNSSLFHPLGYAPGLRTIEGGDVYSDGDTITIGADTYLLVQLRQGAFNTYAQMAVKIS